LARRVVLKDGCRVGPDVSLYLELSKSSFTNVSEGRDQAEGSGEERV
jgi:hypothetical protein